MKKLLIIGVIILLVFFIYIKLQDKEVYYVALGDELSLGINYRDYMELGYNDHIKAYLEDKNKLEIFINDYATQNYRITDIINDIKNNKEIEIEKSSKNIKNALIKADLVTISIGTNDIKSKINPNQKDINKLYRNMEEIISDLEKMLELIREYCKEDIVLVGFYIYTENEEQKELYNYTNERFKSISEEKNIHYINLYEIIDNEYFPNEEDYLNISNEIKKYIDKEVLN